MIAKRLGWAVWLLLGAWACSVEATRAGQDPSDGGSVSSSATISGAGGGGGGMGDGGAGGGGGRMGDGAIDVADAGDPDWPRCPAATYTTSPSGSFCDPTRILVARGLAGFCWGPPASTHCNQLRFDLVDSDATPAGFECNATRVGIQECFWIFDTDGSMGGNLDEEVLEALCGLTFHLRMATITCVQGGS